MNSFESTTLLSTESICDENVHSFAALSTSMQVKTAWSSAWKRSQWVSICPWIIDTLSQIVAWIGHYLAYPTFCLAVQNVNCKDWSFPFWMATFRICKIEFPSHFKLKFLIEHKIQSKVSISKTKWQLKSLQHSSMIWPRILNFGSPIYGHFL